jgi:hypothetical protein
LWVKIIKFFDEDPGSGMETVRIRDGKKSDPGSGINIPDPQHCWDSYMKFSDPYQATSTATQHAPQVNELFY